MHMLKLVVYPIAKEIMRWLSFQTLEKDDTGCCFKVQIAQHHPRCSDPARPGLKLHRAPGAILMTARLDGLQYVRLSQHPAVDFSDRIYLRQEPSKLPCE